MLLTKVAIIKWNNKNRKYYESLGYKFTKSGDSFKVPVEQLTPSSKAEVEVLCDFCKEVVVKKKYQVYIKQHHVKYGDCCAKCQPIKNKLCCLDKYGVDNGSKTQEAKDKIKEVTLEKYGVDNPAKSVQVKQKISEKSKENSKEARIKAEITCLKKYGTTNVMEVPEFKEKIKATCLERYGVECGLSSDEIRAKGVLTLLEQGDVYTSKQQIELCKILKAEYGDCELNQPCGRFSLDCVIIVNGIHIDVEFDGRYWHQDKQRDRRRDEVVKSKGYKIFRILSDKQLPTIEQIREKIDFLITTQHKFTQLDLV